MLSARIGMTPNDILGFDLSGRYVDSESEFDAHGGADGDDPVAVEKRKSLFLRGQGTMDLLESKWRQTLGMSFASHDRSSDSSSAKTSFESQLCKTDWQNNFYFNDANILTAGVEHDYEQGKAGFVLPHR